MNYNKITSYYFQEKLKATFFKIIQKTTILGKTEFSSKFCSDQFFFNPDYEPLCPIFYKT